MPFVHTGSVPSAYLGVNYGALFSCSWQRYPRLDAVVVAGPDLDDFLSRNARHIALFNAPQRQSHDVGTVVHPSAETAIRLLDCPVIIGAGVAAPPNAAPGIGDTAQSIR